jgi:fructosamine-3-kinase
MTVDAVIDRALREAGVDGPVTKARDLSGGCIHRVRELILAGGMRLVAKINNADQIGLFREEAAGLEALAGTRTVLVPRPLAVTAEGSATGLLMTAITQGPARPRSPGTGSSTTITLARRPSPTAGTTTGSGSTPTAGSVTS